MKMKSNYEKPSEKKKDLKLKISKELKNFKEKKIEFSSL